MQVRHTVMATAVIMLGLTGAASAQGMSEGQARSALAGKCGSGASSLHADPAGNWHGFCNGSPMMVSPRGVVAADTGYTGRISEDQARAAILNKCGSGASNLTLDSNGVWHGYCGGSAMMVDAQGVAGPDKAGFASGSMSEGQARSAMAGKCGAGTSNLSPDANGGWHGYCNGAAMMVDRQGNVGPDK